VIETGTVGSIVSHIEIGTFIVFGCLSTFHPLLSRLPSSSAERYSESSLFGVHALDMSEPDSSKQGLSVQQIAEMVKA
jgi:hypothetical protein